MAELDVAVVGATGLVGETVIELLEERGFPLRQLHVLASARSAGKRVGFRKGHRVIGDLADFDFHAAQLAIFCADASVAARYAPHAVEAGCTVIDLSSHFRNDAPLIVPEINGDVLRGTVGHIITVPGPTATILSLVLAPLNQHCAIQRLNVVSLEAVSTAGRDAVKELAGQTADLLNARAVKSGRFAKQIAFNVLAASDEPGPGGATSEECATAAELRRLLELPQLPISITCTRVPVFFGNSIVVHVELAERAGADRIRELLHALPGISVQLSEQPGGYPTAVTDAASEDEVYLGRVRDDLSNPLGVDLWMVADNVRRGGALTAVQIAEILVKTISEI